MYRDSDLSFYKALGDRKLSPPWNPFKLISGMLSLIKINSRSKEKKIEGHLAGE
jgi:hypothetical protein